MQEYILIFIVVIILFRLVSKFIIAKSYQGFQKAAEDFMKSQQEVNKRRPEGSVTVKDFTKGKGTSGQQDGEYVDYEEIK